mmetsp:Transcript_13522/g.30701  ORF Transcript_13522/g.30701 Transcript_13522/m.30701 type:complete len:115 (+) Transcript_13522:3493-3837(+)
MITTGIGMTTWAWSTSRLRGVDARSTKREATTTSQSRFTVDGLQSTGGLDRPSDLQTEIRPRVGDLPADGASPLGPPLCSPLSPLGARPSSPKLQLGSPLELFSREISLSRDGT